MYKKESLGEIEEHVLKMRFHLKRFDSNNFTANFLGRRKKKLFSLKTVKNKCLNDKFNIFSNVIISTIFNCSIRKKDLVYDILDI